MPNKSKKISKAHFECPHFTCQKYSATQFTCALWTYGPFGFSARLSEGEFSGSV